jgi:hypothetical protein
MIALNETDESAAEVPFFLPDNANLPNGLAGITFTLGDVQIKLPGGSWISVALIKIREIGFGQYCARLTAAQTVTAGTVYIRATVTGAQPYFGSEIISDQGGDVALNQDGMIPFFLPDHDDPVNGPPITGHTFTSGQVKIALPNAALVDATLANVAEIGFGGYAYALVAANGDTSTRGKAYLFVDIGATSQRYLGYVSILGLSVAPFVPPIPPSPVVVPTVVASSGNVSYEDHVSIAVSRLPEQFKFPLVS